MESNAFVVRLTNVGTDRASGGSFERPWIQLTVFGDDGLVARIESFDAEREDDALERFDQLSAEPLRARVAAGSSRPAEKRERRVQPNAATANAARADAAIADRDVDAFLARWGENCEVIDHPTGTAYGREGLRATWRSLFRVRDLTYLNETLASLGGSLGLFRGSVSASASAGGTFDVGAYEVEQIFLNEVDAEGKCRRSERFAADRLGDAVVRLYERYAELLPARSRARPDRGHRTLARGASGTARPRSHGRVVGGGHRLRRPPHGRVRDPASGAHEFRAALGTLFEIADDLANRIDDILALRADALLLRLTNSGTDRASGGTYERPFLVLCVLGADGLVTAHRTVRPRPRGRGAGALRRADPRARARALRSAPRAAERRHRERSPSRCRDGCP